MLGGRRQAVRGGARDYQEGYLLLQSERSHYVCRLFERSHERCSVLVSGQQEAGELLLSSMGSGSGVLCGGCGEGPDFVLARWWWCWGGNQIFIGIYIKKY